MTGISETPTTEAGREVISTVASLAGWTTNDDLVADITPLVVKVKAEAVVSLTAQLEQMRRDYLMAQEARELEYERANVAEEWFSVTRLARSLYAAGCCGTRPLEDAKDVLGYLADPRVADDAWNDAVLLGSEEPEETPQGVVVLAVPRCHLCICSTVYGSEWDLGQHIKRFHPVFHPGAVEAPTHD